MHPEHFGEVPPKCSGCILGDQRFSFTVRRGPSGSSSSFRSLKRTSVGPPECTCSVGRRRSADSASSKLRGNAGDSISQGLEVDGRWLLAEGFTLGGSVAYLDATYDEFTGGPTGKAV